MTLEDAERRPRRLSLAAAALSQKFSHVSQYKGNIIIQCTDSNSNHSDYLPAARECKSNCSFSGITRGKENMNTNLQNEAKKKKKHQTNNMFSPDPASSPSSSSICLYMYSVQSEPPPSPPGFIITRRSKLNSS